MGPGDYGLPPSGDRESTLERPVRQERVADWVPTSRRALAEALQAVGVQQVAYVPTSDTGIGEKYVLELVSGG